MAEAPRMIARGLEQLEQEITCGVCHRHLHEPKILPCCHYFCGKCVEDLAARARAGLQSSVDEFPLPCPKCAKNVVLSAGACVSDQLPYAVVVKQLKEMHSRMAKLERKVEAQCEMCSSAKADKFCRQCDEFICSECARSHQKMRVKFPDHEITSLADFKRGGAERFPFSLKSGPSEKCADHEEPLKLFCHDCHKLICRDCILVDHTNHEFEFIKKSASQCRGELKESLVSLGEIQGRIVDATKSVSEMKGSISSQGAHVAGQIEQSFAKMIAILTKEKERLLNQASQTVQAKLAALGDQQKQLHQDATEIQTLLDFTEQNIEIVPDEDLLSVHSQLQERVEEELRAKEQVDLQPSEVPNIAVHVSCTMDITEACKKKARVYLFPVEDSSKVHMAEICKETTHFIFDPNDRAHTLIKPVSASLQSLVDDSVITATVQKTGCGLYEVTYCPKTRGRHRLKLEVAGEEITGSPFPVFVKIPPSMLGEPLKVIDGLRHPYAAVFSQEQELLMVTESGGNKIRMYKMSSRALELKEWSDFQVNNPTGLAVDREGCMYIANHSTHSVAKYSTEQQCLKAVGCEGSEPNEFNHPSGMVVEKDRVLVCDRNNCRIQVLNQKLDLVQSFGQHGNKEGELHWPYDLVQDDGGHIYVTDCDNHRIQIFDLDGHYVHSFGTRGSEKGKLKRPMGICLGMDDLLYVTEYDNHRISVFQQDGVHVRSFAQYGRKKGDLCYPIGISLDRDGFLYVCDQGNNRIQVF